MTIAGREGALTLSDKLVNMDNPDILEIWNIVFIQFNKYGYSVCVCVCHVMMGSSA